MLQDRNSQKFGNKVDYCHKSSPDNWKSYMLKASEGIENSKTFGPDCSSFQDSNHYLLCNNRQIDKLVEKVA